MVVSLVHAVAPICVRFSTQYEAADVREKVDFELLGGQWVVIRTMAGNGSGLLRCR